nr:16S rRNA (guanine(966)-N(2))-methyltransferase RsmD [uncultured Neokomagataea sp.]
MRIVGGSLKGRALVAPSGNTTRPTSDRARQAIFDMLIHAPWYGREALENATVLDTYAGTGALGIEALSRGVEHAAFIERDRNALNALRANLTAFQLRDRSRVLSCSTTHPPRAERPYDLVFLDPPYGKNLVESGIAALRRTGWLAEGALIVAETGAKEDFVPPTPLTRHNILAKAQGNAEPDETNKPEILAERRFGAAKVTIWKYSSIVS